LRLFPETIIAKHQCRSSSSDPALRGRQSAVTGNEEIVAAGKNSLNTEQWRRLSDAASFAFPIHADQVRKGTTIPYVAHLMSVAALVLEHGGDEEQAIAGLLHDAIEDCGVEHETAIEERFGARVARIVRASTDAETFPKPPWKERKEAYIAHLEHNDSDAVLVSCADKVHNARAICADLRTHGLAVFDRFKDGQKGTLWYCATLADSFSGLLPSALANEFADRVAEMRHLVERKLAEI
jgi:GTP pyrophosphokinase